LGLFGASWIGALVVAAIGCGGGGDEGCTTVGCAQSQAQGANQPTGQGGSGGAPSSMGVPGGDLLGGDDGSGAPSGLQDGQVCSGVSVAAPTRPINIMILLDASVSMLEPTDRNDPNAPTRWDAVRAALGSFVNSAQAADARVGLQFLGLMPRGDDCSADKYAVPAVPIAPLGSNRTQLIDAMNNWRPGSLTPTVPAVTGSLRYAMEIAQRPENKDIPTVLVLASDGLPTECGQMTADGAVIASITQVADILRSYSKPALDGSGNPTQPPIKTYVVAPEGGSTNAPLLAQAGDAQAFVLAGPNGSGTNLEAAFLDALLRIITKPISCELDLPEKAPDTGQALDFDKVRVRFTAAGSGTVTEYPRTDNFVNCGTNKAWYYDDPLHPKKILLCRDTCQSLSAGDLKIELGCSPKQIVR
jgi:hypothetical protein